MRRMSLLHAVSFLCLLPLLSRGATTDELYKLSTPPVVSLTPDIEVYPSNHALAEDNAGNIIVGNEDGLLIFNGEHWHHHPMPNGQLVRTIAQGENQRIYIGGYDDFGYLEPTPTGAFKYVSLAIKYPEIVPPSFADIWDLLVTHEAVYFKAVNYLFRYDINANTLQSWYHPQRFGALIEDGNEVFVQFRGQGLKRFDHDTFVDFDNAVHWHTQVYDLVRLGERHWLGNTREGKWLEYKNGIGRYIQIQDLPDSNLFFRVRLIAKDTLAMAGQDGAVYVLQWSSKRVSRFAVSNDIVIDVAPSKNGGILAINPRDVMHIAWPSKWLSIDAGSGLRGSVQRIVDWNERWLMLTGAGVFTLNPTSQSSPFSRLDWSDHEVWDLLPINDNQALMADSYQLFSVTRAGATPVSHTALYPRLLVPSPFNPSLVLIGTELGFAVWQKAQHSAPAALRLEWDELSSLVLSIIEVSAREIWLGTRTRGVVKLSLNEDYSAIEHIEYVTDGIEYGTKGEARLATVDNTLIASTEKGVFAYQAGQFTPWKNGLSEVLEKPQVLSMKQVSHELVWAYSYNRLYQRRNETWQQLSIEGLQHTVFRSSLAINDNLIIGADSRLLIYQPLQTSTRSDRNGVRTTQLKVGTPGNTRPVAFNSETPIVVPVDGEVVFEYALPGVNRSETTLYRARLLGFEDELSEWGRANVITYTQLEPGDYRFEVEAKDSSGYISALKPLLIRVPAPWYMTWQVKFILAVALVTLIMQGIRIVVNSRTQTLAREKQKLKDMVEAHTKELAIANQKLESMAHIDGLTGIANRRRLDTYLEECDHNCAQNHRPLSILLIDVDHFKQFNDTFGHVKGDKVLSDVAQLLAGCLRRKEDLVARYGGEEFTAILPGATMDKAQAVAELMRACIEHSDTGVTVSVGVATRQPQDAQSVSQLLASADRALYQAKARGRNRVESALPPAT